MINALELYKRFVEPTQQPLKERGTVLPIGEYEDGSVGFAWPELLAAPGRAVKRSVDAAMGGDSGYYFGDDGHVSDQLIRDSIDIAGGAMTGGLGAAAMGGAADDAARASAQKWLDLYHGTDSPNQFDKLSARHATNRAERAIFAADRPEFAGRYAEGENGRIFKLRVPSDQVMDFDATKSYTRDPFEVAMDDAYDAGKGVIRMSTAKGQAPTYIIRDSDVIRYLNDPLYSNAPTGSSVPLAMNALEKQAPQGIRAYHGSPHDFDRFDLSKIGTGEGAQAYGHGLYFAEAEDVARGYRDKLGMGNSPRNYAAMDQAKEALEFAQGDKQAALKRIDDIFANSPEDRRHAELSKQYVMQPPGRMYEVNIKANPEDFLDWDKPFREQPKHVQDAIESVLSAANRGKVKLTPEDEALLAELGPMTEAELAYDPYASLRGSNLLKSVEGATSAPTASQALREAGIPGIKYLDGNSRGAGEGSSNYVVFDDALIDILRKYSNAPTGAALPLANEAQDTDPAPYGYRPDGTPKGRGFYGELRRPDGDISTEISMGINFGGGETEIPLLVPTLTADERNWLLTNEPNPQSIPPSIVDKAAEHAIGRMRQGMSPFATPQESSDANPALLEYLRKIGLY